MATVAEPLSLFHLPSAWFIAFLSEWLDLPSIGMLDTAMSAKKHRPQFLNSLQSMRSISVDTFSDDRDHNYESTEWSVCWLLWLSLRHIYIERTTLHGIRVDSIFAIPSVRHLKIIGCNDEGLIGVVRSCPALQSLTIACGGNKGEQLTATAFEAIRTNCPDLEAFSYDRSTLCDDSDIDMPIESCEQSAAALVEVFRHCSKLTKISLIGRALYSMALEELHPFCHLIHEVDFAGCILTPTPATRQAISAFISKCCNLRICSYCDGGSDGVNLSVLMTLQESCPLLEELVLWHLQSFFCGVALIGFDRDRTHLRRLMLVCCDLSDFDLRSVAEMAALQELSLDRCKGLTDAGIASLAVLSLTALSIEDRHPPPTNIISNYLTEGALLSFAETNISHTLVSLRIDIGTHRAIDGDQVAIALAACRQLKTVRIDWGRDKGDFLYEFGTVTSQRTSQFT
jgi:hypothetical protein